MPSVKKIFQPVLIYPTSLAQILHYNRCNQKNITIMLNFIFSLCAIFATLALIAIALELKNTRSAIEDLTSIFDEMNMNIRDLIDSEK